MTLYETYRTWTTTNLFVVPTIGIPREKLINIGLLNAYIKDEMNTQEYEGVVYLLFSPKNMENFNRFIEEERKRNIIVDEYDYEDLVMLVCKYPTSIKKDVELLMQGKFSKTSSLYKNMILKSYVVNKMGMSKEVLTIQHQIFSKSKAITDFWWDTLGISFDKDDEVWEIYPESEIFTKNTFFSASHLILPSSISFAVGGCLLEQSGLQSGQ